jgi:hypothetical protein
LAAASLQRIEVTMTTRDRSNKSKEQTIHNSNHKREEIEDERKRMEDWRMRRKSRKQSYDTFSQLI